MLFYLLILLYIVSTHSCSWTDGNNNNYNLVDLINTGSVDYTQSDTSSPTVKYVYNICHNTLSKYTCTNTGEALIVMPTSPGQQSYCSPVAAPNIDPTLSTLILKAPSTSTSTGRGVTLTYAPTPSASSSCTYNFIMNLECDSSVDKFTITSAVGTSSCLITFAGRSKYACPNTSPSNSDGDSSSGLSGGWVFFIIFIVVTFLYLIIGIGYNIKVSGLSGVEAIPNYSFWTDLPSLVYDGCVYFKDFVMEKCGYGKVGYEAA